MGYGVVSILSGFNEPDPHIILAHEIGHLLGAPHYKEQGYIMNAVVTGGYDFHASSIDTMRKLNSTDCLDSEYRVEPKRSTKLEGLISLFLPVLFIGYLVKKVNGNRSRKH